VLVELVIAGRHRAGADVLLSRYADPNRRVMFVSAAHGLIEAANAVRRLVRQSVLDPDAGASALEWLGRLELVLDATAPRLRRIWGLRDRMSAYDAAYAAAADAFGTPLLTVDTGLLRACAEAGIAAIHLDELGNQDPG
jgi:predicted nucleic acid-binding protein